MATLDGAWRRPVSEIDVEFGSARALELFRTCCYRPFLSSSEIYVTRRRRELGD